MQRLREVSTALLATLMAALIVGACDSIPNTAGTSATPSAAPTATATGAEPAEIVASPTADVGGTNTHLPTRATVVTQPATPGTAIDGKFQANGQELKLQCGGSGSPTIVVEAGEGQGGSSMASLTGKLIRLTTTCYYDRANTGDSGSAPVPRTAQNVADDLNALLASAKVPGPYLLVGHSAGGLLVQLYAREFPDQVVGVVAMNPVPPAHPWLDQVPSVFTLQELTDEKAYYAGKNGETLDYTTSSAQLSAAAAPPNIPFEMLISTDAQCDGDSTCLKSYKIYEQIERDVAAAWPGGNFSEVKAHHEIYDDKPDEVVAMIQSALAKAKH